MDDRRRVLRAGYDRLAGGYLARRAAAGQPLAGDTPGWRGRWLGVEMFFSGFDAEANRRMLRDAGLVPLRDEIATMRETGGEASVLWVIARRPNSR